jgi:hypothetical protein
MIGGLGTAAHSSGGKDRAQNSIELRPESEPRGFACRVMPIFLLGVVITTWIASAA